MRHADRIPGGGPRGRSESAGQIRRQRQALLLLAPLVIVALIAGVWSGLARLGLEVPLAGHLTTVNHAGVMISGFIGTVIGIERAVAFGRLLGYSGPVLSVVGAAFLILLPESNLGPTLMVASGCGLVGLFLAFLHRQLAFPLGVMTVGISCWLIGNVVWMVEGWSPREVLPWWIAFLALTIAGERLELARFLPLDAIARTLLVVAASLASIGAVMVTTIGTTEGARTLGAGCAGLGIWLLQHDTARRTLGRGGTATYAGAALLIAYCWLTLTGIALVLTGFQFGAYYDPISHAFFLGFVFGAIYAHAPIILPAVTGLPFYFMPRVFFGALVVLHTSVALRVSAGALEFDGLRQVSGILHAVAILLLAGAIAAGLTKAQKIGDTGH